MIFEKQLFDIDSKGLDNELTANFYFIFIKATFN